MTDEKNESMTTTNNVIQNPDAVKAKRPRRKKSNNYVVTSEELLYKLSDAGLLCELRGIKNREPRAWYFNRNPDVKAVIDQFKVAGGAV